MAYTEELQRGRAGTIRTAQVARSIVEKAKRDERIVRLARRIVRNVPERDGVGELSAIASWVAANTRFVRDPVGVEALDHVQGTLAGMSGDCDEQITLAAALAECIGYPTRFRVGGDDEDHYRHIWAEALDRSSGRWFPLDPINRSSPAGWAAPFRTTESYPLLGDEMLGAITKMPPRPMSEREREGMEEFRLRAEVHPKQIRYVEYMRRMGMPGIWYEGPAPSLVRGPSGLEDIGMEAIAIGSGGAPFGSPQTLFPRAREARRPRIGASFLEMATRSMEGARYSSTLDVEDADYDSTALSDLGQADTAAGAEADTMIARLVAQARRTRRVPQVFGTAVSRHTNLGPGGEALPRNMYDRYGYLLRLKAVGWTFVPGRGARGWVRGIPGAGEPVPLPPPLPPQVNVPIPGPYPGGAITPPPNYGQPIPFPMSPTAQPQYPYYPPPVDPYGTQPQYYQQPPPSFEQGRSFVTPTAEFAAFGAEANLTPTGYVDEEAEAAAKKPAMNPLMLAGLAAAAVWFFTRKRRGAPTGG